MSNKELNYDELEKVTGGFSEAEDTYMPSDHGPIINRKDFNNYKGYSVYAVKTNAAQYYVWGTIANVEKRGYLYVIKMNVEGLSDYAKTGTGCEIGSQQDFKELEYTFFLK